MFKVFLNVSKKMGQCVRDYTYKREGPLTLLLIFHFLSLIFSSYFNINDPLTIVSKAWIKFLFDINENELQFHYILLQNQPKIAYQELHKKTYFL